MAVRKIRDGSDTSVLKSELDNKRVVQIKGILDPRGINRLYPGFRYKKGQVNEMTHLSDDSSSADFRIVIEHTIEEAVRDKNFWREKICGEDLEDHKDIFRVCFQDGEECRVERGVRHKDGRLLTFIDHAMPARDEEGRIRWIEGIMMDISQLKKLQERALRTEEIRILGEISARVAHEIRNPLVTAGGFSRRLRDSLPEKDPHRRLAQVIVGEVARMESFLKILLSSIRPFELSVTEVDLNDLLRSGVKKLDDQLKSKDIRVV